MVYSRRDNRNIKVLNSRKGFPQLQEEECHSSRDGSNSRDPVAGGTQTIVPGSRYATKVWTPSFHKKINQQGGHEKQGTKKRRSASSSRYLQKQK